ncbi:MAG: hypothetical protein SGJ01_03845 [Gemmatimonadota bacterium]|nr:hypothetical protein [Gemmatimonadota bacterium]
MRIRFRLISAALGALVLACSGAANIIGPGNQLEVTNAPDDFQFQVTSLANVDQTLRYTWTNTGDSANVNQSSAVTGGTATLTVRDPAGVVVYQSNLQTNGTFHSSKSTTGAWKIEVKLVNADGMVNFRVQKAP